MATTLSLLAAALLLTLSSAGFAYERRQPAPTQAGETVRSEGRVSTSADTAAREAAAQALREERPARVLELLEQSTLQARSPTPEACDLLAQAYLELGRWEDAEMALSHGRKSTPGSPLLRTSQANLHFALGRVKLDDGQAAQARSSFEKALAANAPRPPAGKPAIRDRIAAAYRDTATAAERAGDSEKAIGLLKDALELDPDNPPGIRLLGNVLRGARRTKDAISFYELYLMYAPADREMRDELAELYREVGDDAKAMQMSASAAPRAPVAEEKEPTQEEDFELELAAAPDDRGKAEVHTAWGRAAANERAYAKAAGHFRRALELTPGNRSVSLALADVLRLGRKTPEARRLYEDLLELDANDHPVRFQLAKLLVASGASRQALPHLERLAREPSLERELLLDAYNWLGIAHAQLSNFAAASEAWTELLRLEPRHANAHYNVGQILEKQSKFDEAIAAFEKAVESGERDPDFMRYLERLGLAYRQTGRLRAAADVWNRLAASAKPGSPAAKRARQFLAQQGSSGTPPAAGDAQARPAPGTWRRAAPEARARLSGAAASPPLPAPATPVPAPNGASGDPAAAADEAFRQGRLEEALRGYETALAARPSDGALYFKMGDLLHRTGDIARERALFRQLLARSDITPQMTQAARYRLQGLGER